MDVVFASVVHTLMLTMMPAHRPHLIVAGLSGFSGIALGAAGAHGQLHDALAVAGTLDNWATAVLYHLIHSVALVALPGWVWIGRFWIAGILLFSGSIYWLALGGPKFLGPVTPLGGLAFLAGWGLLAWKAYKLPNA